MFGKLKNVFFQMLPIICGILIISCSSSQPVQEQNELRLESPDGSIGLSFQFTGEQRPVYSVWHRDSLLLEDSKLGIVLEDTDFSSGLSLEEVTPIEKVN